MGTQWSMGYLYFGLRIMESRFEPWLNPSHCVLGQDTTNTLMFLSPSKSTILQNVRLGGGGGGKPVMD